MATIAQPPSGVSTGPHLDNRRVAAALIDLAIPAAIVAVASVAGLSFTRGVLLVAVGWTLYYFFALESGDGQTLGKRAMKLRVVSADGSPASMGQIAKRTFVRILDGHIVGLIVMLATGERRQRLGDIVAGTVVTEATTTETATAQATATEPAPHLAPAKDAQPRAESVPWHKRSLKMPARSKPSVPKAKGSLSLPSLRKRSRSEEQMSSQTSAPGPASMTGAAMPGPMPAQAVPEVQPFEPFSERPEAHEPPEPYEAPEPEPIENFMQREVEIEPESVVAFDDDDDEPSLTLDDGPTVEPDEPEYDLPFEDAREPVVELDEPEPIIERDNVESVSRHEDSRPEDDESRHEQVTIKPIETVSAIDLVMQDADDRRPGSR